MKKFCGLKFTSWNIDLNYIEKNSIFFEEITNAFESAPYFEAPEKIGEGKSLANSVLPAFRSFDFIYDFIQTEIKQQYTNLEISKYYSKQRLKLKRCWANKIYKGTQGIIHHHPNSMVFLLYIETPNNSSNLVFVSDKHIDKLTDTIDLIPEEDMYKIQVEEGLCVLHDGNILHAVSEHKNELPRQVIVFEFETIFR